MNECMSMKSNDEKKNRDSQSRTHSCSRTKCLPQPAQPETHAVPQSEEPIERKMGTKKIETKGTTQDFCNVGYMEEKKRKLI